MKNSQEMAQKIVVEIFTKKKVLTLTEASELLNRTRPSAKYHIKKCGAVTSFNKNARYYSLPGIIDFDENGLWEHDNVRFSKQGTALATIANLVENSHSGLSGDEVLQLLKCPPYPLLARLMTERKLRRERILGRYIYFSIEDGIFREQRKRRFNECEADNDNSSLAHIFSLVERIKNPNISIREIAKRLRRKNMSVTNDGIRDFFIRNEIMDCQTTFPCVKLLRSILDETRESLSSQFLFKQMPEVSFDAYEDVRTCCGKRLKRYKTKDRKVYTMHIGRFSAHERMVRCDICSKVYHSTELSELVPSGCAYGYDVIVHIGESKFFGHHQAVEIQADLRERNIPISVSEIEYLAKKFIIYLSIIHERNNTGIVEMMDANGGYILHIDALGGKGRQRLISGVDGVSDFVLGNAKIKSEHSDHVAPFLEKIKKQFGSPLAVVQDMGRGIMKASRSVFPKVVILICHFHFLRDIGKDLLEENYDIIRKRLRHYGFLVKLREFSKELKSLFENSQERINEFHDAINCKREIDLNDDIGTAIYLYTLIEWILDWKNESTGYGFPFDRPHFDLALRVRIVFDILEMIKDDGLDTGISVLKTRSRLKSLLESIAKDGALRVSMREIGKEIGIFDELRTAMRVAPKNGNNGLNDDGGDEDIKTIEASVDEFRLALGKNHAFSKGKKGLAFLKQMDKYKKQLFSDPIIVKTADGIKVIQPQRTNNLMERMFRDFTRDDRRKTGTNSVDRTVQAMIDDTPLVKNLKNDKYMKIIIGERKNLAKVFSEIDVDEVRTKMRAHGVNDEKIPKKIQSLLKEDKFSDMLSNIGEKFRAIKKSN